LSLAQLVPQMPLLQVPVRHWSGAVHAPPVSVPHLPSAAQRPDAQTAARVQVSPVASLEVQRPAPEQ